MSLIEKTLGMSLDKKLFTEEDAINLYYLWFKEFPKSFGGSDTYYYNFHNNDSPVTTKCIKIAPGLYIYVYK